MSIANFTKATSSTIKISLLAFNSYNGYSGDKDRDAARNYSRYFLFDSHLLPYYLRDAHFPIMSGFLEVICTSRQGNTPLRLGHFP
ncbi:DUF6075 family protein [Paenibacillus macerans]|uniref:DUF6075 family protein n=1 Tax=Paenibacillus macerans TaxID=44252 RepID=UPI003D31D72F